MFDQERELLSIDKWIELNHLYLQVSRYASPKELGFKEHIGKDGRIGYTPPSIALIFERALSLNTIPKSIKKKIIWAISEIEMLDSVSKKSKR